MNDADIEMAQLAEQGNMIAAGVCPACEEALDPIAYEKRKPGSYRGSYTAEVAAECVGPHSNIVPGYHDACMDEENGW